MNFIKSIKNFFTGEVEDKEEEEEQEQPPSSSGPSTQAPKPRGTKRGRAVHQAQLSVPRRPLLENAGYGSSGGVQGLSWFLECLKRDKDDDVAVEFLKETQTGKEPVRTRMQKVQQRHLRPLLPSDMVVLNGEVLLLPRQ